MLKQIPTTKTVVSVTDLINSLIKYWQKTYNEVPKKEQILTFVSQIFHETGSTSHCWCYNFGNIKLGSNIKYKNDPNVHINYCVLKGVWEIVNGQKVILPPTDSGSWFRAFETLNDGVEYYGNFFKNSTRYKLAWKAVQDGNPTKFAHELRVAGYYTDFEEKYAKGMMNYYNKYMADPNIQKIFDSLQPKETPPVPKPVGAVKVITNIFSNLFGKKS